jgi:hypothetical protein
MITIRFPTGLAITYNDANYVVWGQSHHTLSDGKGGRKIAFVPNDCIIEFVQPCTVTGHKVSVNDALDVLLNATKHEREAAARSASKRWRGHAIERDR